MTTRWLFADQLGPQFLDAPEQPVLLVESRAVLRRRRFHRAKAHLLLSALRHRALELGDQAVFLQVDSYDEALRQVEGAPDVCFAEAHSVGLGHRLELLALERAAEHLAVTSGYVAMNVSPGTLLRPQCAALLERLPLDRVLLELSEHDEVEDYAGLEAVLQPLRAAGLRLAVDDVGAGFSSLRHIVQTSPDVLKLDRSIIDGVAADPVLRTLVQALVGFAHGCGATVVAEGIETAEDAAALLELAVDLGQGWHFGRPGPASSLDGSAPPPATAEPLPTLQPVHVPQQRAPTERASRWTSWPASRGHRRAGKSAGSYPGV